MRLLTIEAVLGLLTDREKIVWGGLPQKKCQIFSDILVKSLKAQQELTNKEWVEWGDERVKCEHLVFYHKRRNCHECWQARLKEIGNEPQV